MLPEPNTSTVAPAPRAQFWQWPPLALGIGFALIAFGLWLGRGEWIVNAQPSATRLFWLDSTASKAVFFAGCLIAIAVARLWPRARDPVHLVLGVAWFVAACGWQYSVCMTAVALLVFYGGARLHPHLAMLLTAMALLLGARFVFGGAALYAGSAMPLAHAALRLIYYAFELRAVRRPDRSLTAMLAYAPFSLLLWPGPTQISYLTLHTPRSQAELDRLGAAQLFRGAAKLIACAAILRARHAWLPDVADFVHQGRATQLVYILLPYPLLFFLFSIRQDIAGAFCNFSGQYAPDAFNWPFLAGDPIEYWRRWQTHVVEFLRRAFIYEAARRFRRSLVVMVIAGMAGSALYHAFKGMFMAGPEMRAHDLISVFVSYILMAVPVMIVSIPIYKYQARLGPGWKIFFVVFWQLVFTVGSFVWFGDLDIFYGKPLPDSGGRLLYQFLRH